MQNRYGPVTRVLRARSSIAIGMNAITDRKPARELASRENDGFAVVLLWNPGNDAVTLSVADSRTGARFELRVDGEHALDAFYHPFAYAA